MNKFTVPENIQEGSFSFIIDPYSCEHIKNCIKCKSLVFRDNNKLYPYGCRIISVNEEKNLSYISMWT